MTVLDQLDRFDHWSIEKKGFSIFATADGYNVFIEMTTCRAVDRLLAELARNSCQSSPNCCKPRTYRRIQSETDSESRLLKPKSFGRRLHKTCNGRRSGVGRPGRRPSKTPRVSNRQSVRSEEHTSELQSH